MKKIHRKPSFNYEGKVNAEYDFVFGMDEVGRGSFAGPLVASAVCFKKKFTWFKEINDSKLLTHKKREQLSKLILKNSIWSIEEINVEMINKSGIGESNRRIFENLIKKITKQYKNNNIFFLIDGRKQRINNANLKFIIKGDRKSISIAASSIIAKVYRDNLMKKYHKKYPQYNFINNKGYGTKFHREAISKFGFCNIHRTIFNLNKFL